MSALTEDGIRGVSMRLTRALAEMPERPTLGEGVSALLWSAVAVVHRSKATREDWLRMAGKVWDGYVEWRGKLYPREDATNGR